MEEPLKRSVQEAFAHGLREIWLVLIGICSFAFIVSLFMEGLPLHTSTDKKYGVAERSQNVNLNNEDVTNATT